MFTDEFFNFPVKIYDRKEVREAIQKMKDEPLGRDVDDPSWVKGWARVPYSELKAWHDDTVEDASVSEIAEKGHDSTYVMTYSIGNFECLWKKERFEKELNSGWEEYEKNQPQASPFPTFMNIPLKRERGSEK